MLQASLLRRCPRFAQTPTPAQVTSDPGRVRAANAGALQGLKLDMLRISARSDRMCYFSPINRLGLTILAILLITRHAVQPLNVNGDWPLSAL